MAAVQSTGIILIRNKFASHSVSHPATQPSCRSCQIFTPKMPENAIPFPPTIQWPIIANHNALQLPTKQFFFVLFLAFNFDIGFPVADFSVFNQMNSICDELYSILFLLTVFRGPSFVTIFKQCPLFLPKSVENCILVFICVPLGLTFLEKLYS